jgi:hypothetical protein
MLVFLIISCDKVDPPCITCPSDVSIIKLDTLTVDPTEVKLKVVSSGLGYISIKRDAQEIFRTIGLAEAETLFVTDDSLKPHHSYSYRAYLTNSGHPTDSTGMISVTTMDTSNHNFEWNVDTLGDGANSNIRDVSIVNDTFVVAVGEIYKKDSTGQFDNVPYNYAVWNGSDWL